MTSVPYVMSAIDLLLLNSEEGLIQKRLYPCQSIRQECFPIAISMTASPIGGRSKMYEEISMRLIGVAPLLMHSGKLADPLDTHAAALARLTSKRMKTTADIERIAEIEWNGSLWLTNGRPSVPSEAIESCLVAAGKSKRMGSKIKAGVIVKDSASLEYGENASLKDLFQDKRFVYRCGVKVNNRTIIRTRPMFRQWSVSIDVLFLPTMVDRMTIIDLACYAGEMIGIGDYRPRFGRFKTQIC